MVIDFRKQKRIIKIELEVLGSCINLDELVDDIVKDLEIILKQRKSAKSLKVEIILE